MKTKRKRLAKWPYIFVAPFILTYIAFYIYPMLYSFLISFTDWTAVTLDNRNFVGLKNYIRVFTSDPLFWKSILNTVKIMIIAMPLTIVSGLLVAVLMFNMVRGRQLIQTINFLPYITMPIAIGLIFANMFNTNIGVVNTILMKLGIISEKINWLGDSKYAFVVVILICIWKNFGYNTIIYLAALTGIDPTLYEAAMVDGAGKIKQTIHVTMPGIAPFIALMTIMSIGSVLNAGFDQIFNLYSPAVYATGDIIDTLVYRLGLINQQYSLSAAVGLLKSVVSCILVLTGYKLADKYAGYKVW